MVKQAADKGSYRPFQWLFFTGQCLLSTISTPYLPRLPGIDEPPDPEIVLRFAGIRTGQWCLSIFENPPVLTESDIMTPIRAGFERYGTQGQAAFNMVLNAVKVGLTESIRDTILLNLGLMLLIFIVVCFLKEIPLRSRKEE